MAGLMWETVSYVEKSFPMREPFPTEKSFPTGACPKSHINSTY